MLFNIHISIERWKYNKEYGLYVSSLGRFKNEKKQIIKPKVNPTGYLIIKNKLVHRVVMETFKPIENYDKMTVDHLDHNKRNNCLSNLEWVTSKENRLRADIDLTKTIEPKDYCYKLGTSKYYISYNQLHQFLSKEQNYTKLGVHKKLIKAIKGGSKQIKMFGYEIILERKELI